MVYFLCKAYDSDRQNCYFAQSLPVRGAWIEIAWSSKSCSDLGSLPVRGAWIEIAVVKYAPGCRYCRSPCGERGLKSQARLSPGAHSRRSPCGERGLKSVKNWSCPLPVWSLPVRGAWIEIIQFKNAVSAEQRRSPCGERGLKSHRGGQSGLSGCRRSPCGERGLKSSAGRSRAARTRVAPRAGSVD